jgi:hypothetical protein
MDRNEVKKRILEAVGNPVSGALVENLDAIVDAIVGRDDSKNRKDAESAPTKETRVVEAAEKR